MEKLLKFLTIECDKALHAMYGLIVFNIIAIFSYKFALLLIITVAILKELYDKENKEKHTQDVKDIFATVAFPILLSIFYYIKDSI